MEQSISLQPDGRTAINRATVRMFGVPVARLSETISRQSTRLADRKDPDVTISEAGLLCPSLGAMPKPVAAVWVDLS